LIFNAILDHLIAFAAKFDRKFLKINNHLLDSNFILIAWSENNYIKISNYSSIYPRVISEIPLFDPDLLVKLERIIKDHV